MNFELWLDSYCLPYEHRPFLVWPLSIAAARNHVASPSYHIYLWPLHTNMQPSYNMFTAIEYMFFA